MLSNNDIRKVKQAFKVVSMNPKYSWMIGSDVLLERDDYLQEVITRLLSYDKHEIIVKSEAHLYTYVLDAFKRIYRDTTQGDKREGMLDKDYLSDMEEHEIDRISFSVSQENRLKGVVKDTLDILKIETGNTKVEMLIDYYVFGYSFEEIANTYSYYDKSGARKAVESTVKKLTPDIKKYFNEVREFAM